MITKFLTDLYFALVGTVVHAEGIGEQIGGGISKIGSEIMAVINPVAIVAVICCGFYLVLGSDPQYIKKAKSWGISILIGLIIANLADKIVGWASGLATGS